MLEVDVSLRSQARNEGAKTKIIGLTLETRPDCIDIDEVRAGVGAESRVLTMLKLG